MIVISTEPPTPQTHISPDPSSPKWHLSRRSTSLVVLAVRFPAVTGIVIFKTIVRKIFRPAVRFDVYQQNLVRRRLSPPSRRCCFSLVLEARLALGASFFVSKFSDTAASLALVAHQMEIHLLQALRGRGRGGARTASKHGSTKNNTYIAGIPYDYP